MNGKRNMATDLLFLAGFMVYGVILIYLRDFAPGEGCLHLGVSLCFF